MSASPDFAPLPWLDDAPSTATTATATQAWANPELAPIRLVVRYRYTAPVFRRILLTQSLRQLRIMGAVMLVIFALFLALVLGLAAYLSRTTGRTPPIWTMLGVLFGGLLIAPLVIMSIVVAVAYVAAPLAERFSQVIKYEILREGVRVKSLFGRQIVTWGLLSRITREKGDDIHLVLTYGMGAALVVPGTLFADADAVTQFHDAVTALWKAKGTPVAVPESVRTAFAPVE